MNGVGEAVGVESWLVLAVVDGGGAAPCWEFEQLTVTAARARSHQTRRRIYPP
jgi:hypothetical protein